MNVNGMIEHLQNHVILQPWVGELKVYMSRDGEGNGFRPTDSDFDIVDAETATQDLGIETDEPIIVLWPSW